MLRIKISGEEELSSSRSYAIQEKDRFCGDPLPYPYFSGFDETICLHTRHFYITKNYKIKKEFIILETERAAIKSEAEKKTCSN